MIDFSGVCSGLNCAVRLPVVSAITKTALATQGTKFLKALFDGFKGEMVQAELL